MRRRKPIKLTCPYCGGEKLEYRALASWSIKQQEYVVDDIDWDYEPYCHDCDRDIDEPCEKALPPEEVIRSGLMNFDEDT